MMNKVGDEKYYIIISMILGLLVLTLSLYFIFHEYFTEDELDWQQCRQSIILRSNLPNATLAGIGTDIKGAFPLKCRTEVVVIDSTDHEEIYGKMSEVVAEGWYTFGEGKFDFIHREFWSSQSVCMVFARVHFSEKTKKEVLASGELIHTGDFIKYYKSSNIPGTKGSYDEYLPTVSNDTIFNTELYFAPAFDLSEMEDVFFVYRIGKVSGLSTSKVMSVFGKALVYTNPLLIILSLYKNVLTNEDIEQIESTKGLWAVNIDTLDKLECKFLSIPA